jgi:hypothetical protein
MSFDVFRSFVWRRLGFFRFAARLTDQGPYEFAVSGAGDDYIDLFNTYLFVEAQIVNTDGSNLEPIRTLDPSICGCNFGPLGSMSVLFAPNSHVPHWSESVVLQTNPIPISYIRKSFGVLEPYFNRRCLSMCSENRSEPSIGRHGRTEHHTSSQIQIEINWTKLTPESYGHRGTSRWTIYKTSCKAEKPRRRQTKLRKTSKDMFGYKWL